MTLAGEPVNRSAAARQAAHFRFMSGREERILDTTAALLADACAAIRAARGMKCRAGSFWKGAIGLLKWDGHSHSHFCYHGSGRPLRDYLERAVRLGFERYSVTEHPPLPEGWVKNEKLMAELAMSRQELPEYIQCVEELKREFEGRLEVTAGLELDYLHGSESFTNRLLESLDGRLEDVLISVHFLPGRGGMRCVDFTPDDFREGLIDYYGSMERVVDEYFQHVELAVASAAGWKIRKRLGHIHLIEKFRLALDGIDEEQIAERVRAVVPKLREAGVGLDVNTAGMRKDTCRKPYASEWLVKECRAQGIECVYGSDAHHPDDVGQGWEWFAAI
ncbi:histidinol-phosphatase HisJ [Paenibacillus humicola]|uniref:histidinol-phosphatase HisJ n=1 Tax=Paenibacillus humicola TaxID=3110540 RepID=UPI00237A38D5|nr:histidinol-phosphatase HisJ [Paenibacillus humicola]